MNISSKGINLIKEFETCRLTAYKAVPTEIYWTIGWGHYGPDIKQGMKITQQKADDMFNTDIKKYVTDTETIVKKYAKFTPNQNQFDALVSFCYNCGSGNLKTLVNGRTAKEVSTSIPKYNKSGGAVLKGLERRRQAELQLFNTAVTDTKNSTSSYKLNVYYKFISGSYLRKTTEINDSNILPFSKLDGKYKKNFTNKDGKAYVDKGDKKKFKSLVTKKDGTVFAKLPCGYYVAIEKSSKPKVEKA